jgi:hypothetical protein
MPAAQVGQQRFHVGAVLDVVQHQQPARMRLQPPHRPDRRLLVGGRHLRIRMQPERQLCQPGFDRRRPIGEHPPDHRELTASAVDELQRQLALTYPAQPVHRLRDHPRTGRAQPTQPRPLVVGADERARRRLRP